VLRPPASGKYTFWIASDDGSELWLSADARPENGKSIAFVKGWTGVRQWDKFPEQKSAPADLEAGREYFIEALHKEYGGGDSLAVAWEGPGVRRGVIEGRYLRMP
jgi:hypothetical protein